MTIFSLVAKTAFFHAYFQSDFFGKMIFIGLFILSVFCWVVLIHKWKLTRMLKKYNYEANNFFKKNKEKLFDRSLVISDYRFHPYFSLFKNLREQMFEILKKNSFYKNENENVFLSQADMEMIQSHMESEIIKEVHHYEKNFFILSTVITLAPFLGLLGTVWGILVTFSQLQTHSIEGGNSAVLAGLSMALVTTVLGLVVAIPAIVAHNYFKNASKNFKNNIEEFCHNLLMTVEIQYRQVERE